MTLLPGLSPEDIKRLCSGRDYTLLIDVSFSMQTPDCPGATSRWNYMRELVTFIATKLEEFDPDVGIDLALFGGKPQLFENVTAENLGDYVPQQPTAGTTYLGAALDLVFDRYFQNAAAARPATFIVITDGEATDPQIVEKALRNAAQASGSGETIAIGFWQVGYDKRASKFLEKLDDDLGEIDIVDTQNMDAVVENFGSLEVLLAAAIVD